MRFYLVTFKREGEGSYRGMTSATFAADAIRDMTRQGWITTRIQRGTTEIDEHELSRDVERERGRPR